MCQQSTDIPVDEKDELVLLQALWRHGQRAPLHTFKGDLYPKEFWRKGYGELTEFGCQQHYQMGKWIRQRYIDELKFLPNNYDPKTVTLRCSTINRTTESASENFRGLYGDDPNYKFPTPNYHTGVDCVNLPFNNCIRAKKILADFAHCDISDRFRAKYHDVIDKMEKVSHRKFETFVDALFLTDPFTTEKHIGYKLPEEFEKDFETIDMCHRDSLRYLYGFEGHDSEDSVLKIRSAMGSGIVEQLKKNIQGKVNGQEDYKDLKYAVFSSHDTIVLALLSTFEFDKLDYNQNYNVSLGASLFLELWKKPNKEHYIKVLYRRNPKEIYDITGDIKDCSEYKKGIPLEKFLKRWEKFEFEHGPGICQNPQ